MFFAQHTTGGSVLELSTSVQHNKINSSVQKGLSMFPPGVIRPMVPLAWPHPRLLLSTPLSINDIGSVREFSFQIKPKSGITKKTLPINSPPGFYTKVDLKKIFWQKKFRKSQPTIVCTKSQKKDSIARNI